MEIRNTTDEEYFRERELHFLIRTGVPVPIISCYSEVKGNELFNDHYTAIDLIKAGLLQYIGHQNSIFSLRPLKDFKIFNTDGISTLLSGEIVRWHLPKEARKEMEDWLSAASF